MLPLAPSLPWQPHPVSSPLSPGCPSLQRRAGELETEDGDCTQAMVESDQHSVASYSLISSYAQCWTISTDSFQNPRIQSVTNWKMKPNKMRNRPKYSSQITKKLLSTAVFRSDARPFQRKEKRFAVHAHTLYWPGRMDRRRGFYHGITRGGEIERDE